MLHNAVKNCSAGTVKMMMIIIIIRGGDMAKIPYHNFFGNITISLFYHDSFFMLVLLFCLSSAAKIISII